MTSLAFSVAPLTILYQMLYPVMGNSPLDTVGAHLNNTRPVDSHWLLTPRVRMWDSYKNLGSKPPSSLTLLANGASIYHTVGNAYMQMLSFSHQHQMIGHCQSAVTRTPSSERHCPRAGAEKPARGGLLC